MQVDGPRWPPGTLLDRLGPQLAAQLTQLGITRRFVASEALIRQGDRESHLFVLLSGMTKVSAATVNGRTILLAIRVRGDVVGEIASSDGKPRTASVYSCGSVLAQLIPHIVWCDFLRNSPTAQVAFSGVLGDRLRAETDRRIEFAELSARARIARVLATFVIGHGVTTPSGAELPFSLAQSELAAAAECSMASVQSALQELRRSGIVDTRYRRMVVKDVQALEMWPPSG